jgi:hypothetical protein
VGWRLRRDGPRSRVVRECRRGGERTGATGVPLGADRPAGTVPEGNGAQPLDEAATEVQVDGSVRRKILPFTPREAEKGARDLVQVRRGRGGGEARNAPRSQRSRRGSPAARLGPVRPPREFAAAPCRPGCTPTATRSVPWPAAPAPPRSLERLGYRCRRETGRRSGRWVLPGRWPEAALGRRRRAPADRKTCNPRDRGPSPPLPRPCPAGSVPRQGDARPARPVDLVTRGRSGRWPPGRPRRRSAVSGRSGPPRPGRRSRSWRARRAGPA